LLFKKEVALYLDGLSDYFEKKPGIFINTACLYDDQVAEIVNSLGYQGIIATANPWHLAGKHSGQVYKSNTAQPFNILLSNGDGPDNFQISLVNGYGSAYNSDFIDKSVSNEKQIQELFMIGNPDEHSVYAVSLPLSSPSWEHKIPDYTNNPLQKALLKQGSALVNQYYDKLSAEDLKLLMLLCQPDHLLQINQTSKEEGYDHFISSMNWLTDISLRYK
jgi:alpha-amylase